ncbi:MAG: dinB 1 [Gammaproteobacteria bacterium]|jgi:DNA polymerase-4|nr:dinB 1 [Gammaproteobacteria bacterium]
MLNRKIIHIDMDCFYAAIEIRDNPSLMDKPVAVGGDSARSVLCTCNYAARKFGVHSGMPTQKAKQLCQNLVILPVCFEKYKAVSKSIQGVFYEFTPLVEPLALDEAYLDVSLNKDYNNSATLMAQAIVHRIWQKEQLTASAGVAPNKFLAKIASGLNKPNGLYVIPPHQVEVFIKDLPVEKIFGVGRVMLERLHHRGLKKCSDIQQLSLLQLIQEFGKFGQTLYYQSRGIDKRVVEPNRPRKSISVETTFEQDRSDFNVIHQDLCDLHVRLLQSRRASSHKIKSQFVKIKLNNFKIKSAEISSNSDDLGAFVTLLKRVLVYSQPIRLLGIGLRFHDVDSVVEQGSLF